MTPLKVGLALGGGGARGIAHIGVLKVLESEGIHLHMISGTSFGSIVGAMYAQNPAIGQLKDRVLSFLKSEAFRRTKIFFIKRHYEEKKNKSFMTNIKNYLQQGIFWGISLQRTSFISEDVFLAQMGLLLEDKKIEDSVIPFIAVATDLTNGAEVVLSEGPIRTAVAASCAIPGVLPPIHVNGIQLIDGGWVNQVPVEPLEARGVDFVIAVNISEEASETPEIFDSGLDVVLRANEITRCVLSHRQLSGVDFTIRPNIGHIHWSDFWRFDEAIQKGEEAARAAIKPLKQLLWRKRVKKFITISQ
ncbi:MAG: patatin-like phospholipase family protein [Nitrospiria bacterium]